MEEECVFKFRASYGRHVINELYRLCVPPLTALVISTKCHEDTTFVMLLLSLFPPPPASLLSYSGHHLGRYLGEEEWLLCQKAVDLSGDVATTC